MSESHEQARPARTESVRPSESGSSPAQDVPADANQSSAGEIAANETVAPATNAETSIAPASDRRTDSAASAAECEPTQLVGEAHRAGGGDPEIPDQIGRYKIQQLLGEGAFGCVFLARDPELQRQVAIKAPRTDRFDSEDQVQAFLREARTVAGLEHAAIVPVYDVGRTADGAPFVVMKYIAGTTLGERLREQRFSHEECVRLLLRVTDAVGFAHEHDVVHRDLKPANILLDERGLPYVADFGLAVHTEEQRDRAGEIAGTFAYMAPEQVRGDVHRLDGRADIWALGVIFYRLLTGRLPFAGDSFEQISDEIRHREPRPPRQISSDVPADLERIVDRCCAKAPTDRYACCADLSSDLRDWLGGRALAASGDALASSNLRRRVISGLVAGGIVLAAVAAGIALTGSGKDGSQRDQSAVVDALQGDIDILVWDPVDTSRRGISLHDPRARPLRTDDQVRLSASLNRPAYAYLVWIDSEGEALPLYPWEPGDWAAPPASEQPVDQISLPEAAGDGWAITGSAGMETLMMFVRSTPLDPEGLAALRAAVGSLPQQPAQRPGSLAVFENGQLVTARRNRERGPKIFDASKINDPVLRTQQILQERLANVFEYSCGITFASQATK